VSAPATDRNLSGPSETAGPGHRVEVVDSFVAGTLLSPVVSEAILVPGARDVRGSLDTPDESTGAAGTDHPDACVVACPPHPQLGGSRSDKRLTAVADGLKTAGIACLRFDYGSWDEGRGELQDTTAALDWARNRYESVACFGYSFGGCLALAAAADAPDLSAVSALAPAAQIGDAADAVAAVERIGCPEQTVYGERDDTVEWQSVVERARDRGFSVTGVAADHHFVGQTDRVAPLVVSFLSDHVASAGPD